MRNATASINPCDRSNSLNRKQAFDHHYQFLRDEKNIGMFLASAFIGGEGGERIDWNVEGIIF